jgi:hypothetical protein
MPLTAGFIIGLLGTLFNEVDGSDSADLWARRDRWFSNSPNGQFMYLEKHASARQAVQGLTVGNSYVIRFWASWRKVYSSRRDSMTVSVSEVGSANETTVKVVDSNDVSPWNSKPWKQYVSVAFTATSHTHNIKFESGGYPEDGVSSAGEPHSFSTQNWLLLDDVEIIDTAVDQSTIRSVSCGFSANDEVGCREML